MKKTAKKTAKGAATVADDFGRADVFEWKLPPAVLDVLLKDRTTGRNIVWGTRDYERAFGAGTGFGENDEIRRELIADRERPVIRPRVVKDAAEQRRQMLHDNLRASAHKTDSYGILWSCSPVGEDT